MTNVILQSGVFTLVMALLAVSGVVIFLCLFDCLTNVPFLDSASDKKENKH